MSMLNVDGAQLHHEVHGSDGPWLLFISGLGGHGEFWSSQVEAFSGRFRVVTHDHRGHGQSTGGDRYACVEQCADDVYRLMEHHGIETASVVGHSMGGMIAQELALRHPLRVARMAISGSGARLDDFARLTNRFRRRVLSALGREDFCRLQTLLTAGGLADQPLDELLAAEARSLRGLPAVETLDARLQSIAAYDRSKDLGRIRVPVLVISAPDDGHAPPSSGEALAQLLPEGRFVSVRAGGGHFFPRTMPHDYNAALSRFFSATI